MVKWNTRYTWTKCNPLYVSIPGNYFLHKIFIHDTYKILNASPSLKYQFKTSFLRYRNWQLWPLYHRFKCKQLYLQVCSTPFITSKDEESTDPYPHFLPPESCRPAALTTANQPTNHNQRTSLSSLRQNFFQLTLKWNCFCFKYLPVASEGCRFGRSDLSKSH